MECDNIRARFHKIGDIPERLAYHQVNVKDERAFVADTFYDRRAEGYVGHKMPVHHIEMEPVRAGLFYFLHKFFQELINRRIERNGVVVGDEVVALNEYQFRLGQTLVNKFCMIARNHVVSTYDN